ncbi:hypothetical protein [uncultured Pseudodesulfovibrio sp.]|nr:hypothetical protein [uncultured Pseudodesulfovibrio sp.]
MGFFAEFYEILKFVIRIAIFGGIFWLLGFFGIPLLLAAIGSLV